MESRACRGWCYRYWSGCLGGCRFTSCLVPGRCSSCLRPFSPHDEGAVPAAAPAAASASAACPAAASAASAAAPPTAASAASAAAPPAVANALALHQTPELTVKELDAIIPLIEDEINRLDPAKSSSSSSRAPISQRLGDMLAQWEAEKQICTSFISSLPEELTDEVAGNGKGLLMSLLAKALGSMGAVHWLGIGFAFIAWSLDNISSIDQNRDDCIGILRRSLRLLKFTKQVWERPNSDTNGSVTKECLQDSVERAFHCAVFCASSLKEVWILRFVKANTVKDAITMLRHELEEAYTQYTALVGTLILQNQDVKVERQVTFGSTRDDIVGGQEGVIDAALAFLKGSSDVIKVALLHGMGGIGKSTLAMQIFTEFQKSTTFRACRVELPLDTSEKLLCAIQKQILEKVCKHEFKISNLTDGKRHMEMQLSQINDPIFLYVDNVMEQKDLRELLPKATFFPKASRILITSRSKYGTLDLGIMSRDFSYETFEVRKLQPEQARQLLWKQLESNRERRDVGGVVIASEEEMVLSLCAGLPLAIIVVGKYILHEKGLENVGVWREVVKSMQKAEPLDGVDHDELYSRIKSSIQKLHKDVKAAFLDVVFFLHEESRTWEEVERLVSPKYLNILHQRALVQKGQESTGQPEIHDVLKTLGRRMIAEDEQELRIMGMDQLREHNDNGRLKHVVALHAQNELVDVNLLRQMRSLRLLSHMCVTGDSEKGVQLRELRVVKYLKGSMSSVNIDWSKCSSLKEVSWSAEDGVRVFDLEVFKHDSLSMGLEVLALESWKQLKDVEVLETLTCLKELKLEGCSEIESLPDGTASLMGLKKLALPGCSELKSLPQGISALVGLQHLDLHWCESLQSLPDELASLTGLTELSLHMCKSLQSLPDGLASLTSLTWLGLNGCVSLQSLPNGLSSLTGLTWLGLSGCVSLQSLPEGLASLTGLTWLGLHKCSRLQSLPDGLASLTGLTWLALPECERLLSLPDGLASLTGLTGIDLRGCASLQSLPDGLASLTGLTELDLRQCENLQSLPDGLENLTGLTVLGLGECASFQSLLEWLASLAGLRVLYLSKCVSLQSLPDGLVSLTGLTRLDLDGCASLQFLPDGIASLTGLTWLDLCKCSSLQSLPDGLASLTGLTWLDLRACVSLQSLPDGLASLTGLTTLYLQGCASLQSLPNGLASLIGLTNLGLAGCASLQSLPDGLASLTGLTTLSLNGCASLRSLPEGLVSLTSLTTLGLDGCVSLRSLPDGLMSLTGLTVLGLDGCESLQSQT